MQRREFFGLAALVMLAGPGIKAMEAVDMDEVYGLVAQMKTAPGKRDLVAAAMLAGTADMPGNIAYLIAEDLSDPDALWITEVWESKQAHADSLQLPSVQEAIGKAREYIAGMGTRVETRPLVRG